ncbi:NUDIX domain-containing protein [Mucilaginibacter boryungensis]|uniref:NUDIX domain-containing protein n=1 Tax=Mucilaginibacter boryungensis TaxID=768480 RepID=A0ABR9XGE0_9SPHI|nr:NUDIX domain-containing protein [Mucilaginibacter boryungensis]MBE9666296.1 NUDIX domain-containing protein [Mucilaginibacter boryungensis]
MAKQSAGILAYRIRNKALQVFLVHPGGPFWKNKDEGAWSVPKGEFADDEDALVAAKREFLEETGQTIDGEFIELKPVRLKSGKTVHTWAVEAEVDETNIVSNTFPFEWPPKSGKMIEIPEIDKGEWFDVPMAKQKINQAQTVMIDELMKIIISKN